MADSVLASMVEVTVVSREVVVARTEISSYSDPSAVTIEVSVSKVAFFEPDV